MRVQHKSIIVTGAGSGMGREVALLFAKEGARLVLNDYVAETVEETAHLVAQAGGEAIAIRGDVAAEADVERTIRAGVDRFGKLDTLYNNAGIMPDEDVSVTTMDPDVWRHILDVNLQGVALCCKYGIPRIIEAGGGAVVWYFVLGPAADSGSGTALANVVTLAYPVGDLILLTALIAAYFRRSPATLRPSLQAIGVGFIALIAALKAAWTTSYSRRLESAVWGARIVMIASPE